MEGDWKQVIPAGATVALKFPSDASLMITKIVMNGDGECEVVGKIKAAESEEEQELRSPVMASKYFQVYLETQMKLQRLLQKEGLNTIQKQAAIIMMVSIHAAITDSAITNDRNKGGMRTPHSTFAIMHMCSDWMIHDIF